MTSPLLSAETLARLDRLVALARRAPQGKRRRTQVRTGRGIEPGARRDYAPGDDVRLLDWAAYARLDRLLVKVTEALPESRLDLLLDGSGSTGVGAPDVHVRQGLVAAALAACAVAREVRVVLWWAGAPGGDAGGEGIIEVRRPGGLVRLLRWVAGRQPGGPGQLAATAARIASRPATSGSAIVLTDGLDPQDAALAAERLRAAGLDPLVVSCAPGDEVGSGAGADAVRAGLAQDGALEVDLVDAETGARRRALVGPATLAAASEERARRGLALARALQPSRVGLERVAAQDPFEAVATALLRR